MENAVTNSWWKTIACGITLAIFNVFAYLHLDNARGSDVVWGPVKALYGSFGPDKVLTALGAVAALFVLAGLVQKAQERGQDQTHEPAPPQEGGAAKKFHWVDVD